MKEKMFCFQCQEACRNTGCTIAGMCGKKNGCWNFLSSPVILKGFLSLKLQNFAVK